MVDIKNVHEFGKVEKMMPIIIKGNEIKGKRYVDIRKYYRDEEGNPKPSGKGISMAYEDFEAVMDILKSNEADIMAFLEDDVK